ncbi:F-box/FBD/LRR-repeat protein-like protein [Salvia divinorum]|uniref:F-box/FBD/LRR-repeat protein-like protein n=1 Tax=Salvia divinorum TaxID=28513 RepID=A0ABD1GC56_SALDI
MVGKGNFESWFKFALAKKAEIIHIAMYGFKDLDLDFLRLPSTNNGFQCLKDLSLHGLKLTDRDFELLVSNCLALESLTVESSYELKNVSIVGLSKLMRLNLSYFVEVESIVIRDAISLVSLTLYQLSSECTVQLSNTPKLTKLNFQERFGQVMLAEFLDGMPSCIRGQLQVMHLATSIDFYMQKMDLNTPDELLLVDLINIKHLELEINMRGTCPCWYMLSYFRHLVEACSFSDKLVIKYPYMLRAYNKTLLEAYVVPDYDKTLLEAYVGVGRCKLSVKYLEITGYLGAPLQLALALYVVNNARSLESVTVVAADKNALARAYEDFRHIRSVSFSTYY